MAFWPSGGGHSYTPSAFRVGRMCSSSTLQAPDTDSGVHIAVELTGSCLVLGISRTLSLPVLFLCQTCSVALHARQPVDAGNAQIRCSFPLFVFRQMMTPRCLRAGTTHVA